MNLKQNTTQCSLILYIILVFPLIYMKPKFLFKNNGSLKEFGTGKDKTIFPLWLLIGLMAWLSFYVCTALSFLR